MNDLVLTFVNAAAFVAAAFLVAVKVAMRLWRTPDERSVFFLAVSVLGISGVGLAVRFGLPRDDLFDRLVESFYIAVTITMTYRARVHLKQRREAVETSAHRHADPVALDAAVDQIQALLDGVGHLEPCPNPDCARVRAEMAVLAQQLKHSR